MNRTSTLSVISFDQKHHYEYHHRTKTKYSFKVAYQSGRLENN